MTKAEWHNHEEYRADIDLIGMMTKPEEDEFEEDEEMNKATDINYLVQAQQCDLDAHLTEEMNKYSQ